MGRTRSTDGPTNVLPGYILAGFGLDRSWVGDARCRTIVGEVGRAWTVSDKDPVRIGSDVVPGRKMVALAISVCKTCTVQWQCAAYGIQAEVEVGTWSTSMRRLRWLGRQRDWRTILETAEELNIPVHDAVAKLMKARNEMPADGY